MTIGMKKKFNLRLTEFHFFNLLPVYYLSDYTLQANGVYSSITCSGIVDNFLYINIYEMTLEHHQGYTIHYLPIARFALNAETCSL